jgi:hypothetical protein
MRNPSEQSEFASLELFSRFYGLSGFDYLRKYLAGANRLCSNSFERGILPQFLYRLIQSHSDVFLHDDEGSLRTF